MKHIFKLFFACTLFFNGSPARADVYPVNKNIDIKHYAFEINLSDSSDEIKGIATIRIDFKQAGVRNFRLDFVNQKAEKENKGMVIDAITVGDQPITYTHQNDEIILDLPSPSTKNQTMIFTIKYHGVPLDGLRIGKTKLGDRSFFNENWPNRARHWLPTFDHPSDKATSEFKVKAPSHYKVISNGLLLEESEIGNNLKLTHWKQSVPSSCWLFVIGVAEFAVQYLEPFKGKSIESWVYAKNREAGFTDFQEPTKKVLEFYSQYVGPFAYEKLANVQTPSVSGGMESSSAIFYGEDLVTGKRSERTRNVIIHEIAHQWFGNSVTETTWDDAWLSEGFATFFTLLFIENEYGKEEYNKGIAKAKKTIFDLLIKMPDFSIVSPRTAEKELVITGITYQKGAWVLHMLRNLMGETNFKKGIQSYYSKFYTSSATTDDFRIAMEKASGMDFKIFFQQWLFQPIIPKINAKWTFDPKHKKLKINIEQIQKGDIIFNIPVEIAYYKKGSNAPTLLKMRLDKKQNSQTFVLKEAPEKVEVDPRNVLLCEPTMVQKGDHSLL